LGLDADVTDTALDTPTWNYAEKEQLTPASVFTTGAERHAAHVVMQVIAQYGVKRDLLPTSSALLSAWPQTHSF
jgi:hypothetical protein